ncbi:5-methyltetrahydropteroyltriglutamate--homocysteine methyltransferase [Halobaculum sp. MBLA0147]|uniref:5-methyltetrahydropteroyltriglutamate-- homocysteine methyltransferase n=1 Tax=Halobaculum sp. MBLA0147 TaxID=3079934 RepID=UPI0035241417
MTEIVATTTGLYPLPDPAKRELSELKGHQKGDLISGDEGPEVRAAYERARETVVADQLDAGLDRIVEGQLRWDDVLAHPLIVSDAVEAGGIVRYYDNNNFYRDPRIVDELAPSGDVGAELTAATELLDGAEPLTRIEGDARDPTADTETTVDAFDGDAAAATQAVLPGPYTLADLATDEFYDDEAELLAAVADLLAAEVEAFPTHATLFLHEPSYVVNPPGDGLDERASAAVDTVATATDADVVVDTYWDSFEEKPYAHLLDADIDGVGFDFVAGDRDETLYCLNEYGCTDDVALGLVDGQNTLVEEPETVADRVEWVHDNVPATTFETTYVTHNTETFYLPVNRHREKLATLAEGAALARDRLETEVTA